MNDELTATYARSIRRRALLTREGEIDLAKRIERGNHAVGIRHHPGASGAHHGRG